MIVNAGLNIESGHGENSWSVTIQANCLDGTTATGNNIYLDNSVLTNTIHEHKMRVDSNAISYAASDPFSMRFKHTCSRFLVVYRALDNVKFWD